MSCLIKRDGWQMVGLNTFETSSLNELFHQVWARTHVYHTTDNQPLAPVVFIKSIVVFSFTTLCATDLNKVNRLPPSTYLSRRLNSSSFIVFGFFPKRGRCNLFPYKQERCYTQEHQILLLFIHIIFFVSLML